jgi:hypothetical protein
VKPKHPPGEPMTLGNMTSTEDFHQLAAQEAALARAAVTNESRAQHYAMAAYYTRLEGKGRGHAGSQRPEQRRGDPRMKSKHPSGEPKTLGNMRRLGVQCWSRSASTTRAAVRA